MVLAGGSAFGLEAASGVRRFLEHRGIGFPTGAAVVPIVPCAILYDLGIGKANVRPTREMGEAAAAAATTDAVKARRRRRGHRRHGGQNLRHDAGHEVRHRLGNGEPDRAVRVAALVAVKPSATCAIRKPASSSPGPARANSLELADTEAAMKRGARRAFGRQNTTLAVVATNARLSKVGASRLAEMANLGMARTIFPVHTSFDGDLCFALSLGNETADLNTLGVAAAEAVARSIVLAVKAAPSLGGVPGLAGPKNS